MGNSKRERVACTRLRRGKAVETASFFDHTAGEREPADGCEGGDFDSNGSIDLLDFVLFRGCMSGPAAIAVDECLAMDFDGCRNVDLQDYAVFLQAFEVR